MLTDHQKHLLKACVGSLFFDDIKELPTEIQIKAYEAMLSFRYYLRVIDTLKEHDVEEVVRQAGEMLSHPAPEKPCENTLNLRLPVAVHPCKVAIQFNETSKTMLIAHKGFFNLAIHDDKASPSSSVDVHLFIQELINKKLEKLKNNKKPLQMQIEIKETIPKKIITSFSPDTFLTYAIESQLEYLSITHEKLSFNQEKFKAYQLFLRQFKIPEEKIDTMEKLIFELNQWWKRSIFEIRETEKYVGNINTDRFSFVDIVEAKLSRFEHYSASPKADFYTYRALKRIAFANGDVSMRSSLEPDYVDMAYILMQFGQNNGLDEILRMQGDGFHAYHGNALFRIYVNRGVINKETIKIFLEKVRIDPLEIDVIMKKNKKECGNQKEYWYQVKKILLQYSKYTKLLPIEIAKEIFIEAVKRNDFECQMLVLAQSPADFVSKNLLNRENILKLVKPQFYDSVRKIVTNLYPSILSKEDIFLINKLGNGAFSFQISSGSIVEDRLENQRLLTPLYNNRNNNTANTLVNHRSSQQTTFSQIGIPHV